MSNLLYILFGWLIGLFSPRIVETIQRHYRRSELRRSLFVELDDIKGKLAMVACALADRSGKIDRAFLDWIEPIMRSYEADISAPSIADLIKALSEGTDEQLRARSVSQLSQRAEHAPNLKKYTLPFLTSQITSLSMFSPEFQRRVLQIRARLAMINDEIDTTWFYYTKTFDSSLSNENRTIVRGNLEQSYQTIIRLCRDVVDGIVYVTSHENL